MEGDVLELGHIRALSRHLLYQQRPCICNVLLE